MKIDQQTLLDLEIFPRRFEESSLFGLLNHTKTKGGERRLKRMLASPLSDISAIRNRQALFRYLGSDLEWWKCLLDNIKLPEVEKYLCSSIIPVPSRQPLKLMLSRWQYKDNFRVLHQGLDTVKTFFHALHAAFDKLPSKEVPEILRKIVDLYNRITGHPELNKLLAEPAGYKLSVFEVFTFDAILRTHINDQFMLLLEVLHEFDALLALARAHKLYNLTFPKFTLRNAPLFEAQGLYHLFLKNPTPYNVRFNRKRHFLFLTGPNMSGKSVFLKSCGMAVYLAHLGLGVPAESLRLSVYDALMSGLTVEENIRLGYSYFCSEAKRVKAVAECVQDNNSAFIILDELFKGTNIHDAYEASKRIVLRLAHWPNHICALSSHLVELASDLDAVPQVMRKYVDAKMVDGVPNYSYSLCDGVSDMRFGMVLLEQEGVFKMMESASKSQLKFLGLCDDSDNETQTI